ncbi:MAG: heavy metal translocating P-type ATPase [Halieaceae bacterium]|jgi:Cu2+-exporting ATPase|nr:heavy metal translocating P-type ATPase [Halieaceae bacterium]
MNSPLRYTPDTSALEAQQCFHCGEAVRPGDDFAVEIEGQLQPMCCPGCRAVASLIAGSGMGRFYTQRTSFNERPAEPVADENQREFKVYDDPALLDRFSSVLADGRREARLLIGGVTCAACTWLIESSLLRAAGIDGASLNLAQSRLDLSFDPQKIPISEIFARIQALGYRAQPWHSSAQRDQMQSEYRRDLRRLAVAGIGMMQVGMFAIALHAGDLQGIAREYEQLLRAVSLLVTAFVVWFSARGFFEAAWRHLRQRTLVMDLPVALAIGLAFGASAWATLAQRGEVYFDSVVMFTFLLLLARFVEKRLRLRDSLAWQDAELTLPDAVRVRAGDDWELRPRSGIGAGERLMLRSGDTVPLDGQVVAGESAVREDSFSGESLPRRVGPGDSVFAGTLNEGASIEIESTGSYAESRLAALQRSINSARLAKPALASLADRVASVFISVVLLATAITALVWWQIDAERALWVALSVLVISCPCALSLATPASLANSAAMLRRLGVIVYGENALESLAASRDFVFDKTGTLTTGAFRIEQTVKLGSISDRSELLALAAELQRHANHPIASAFSAFETRADIDGVHPVVGAGVEGYWQGRRLRIGSENFCRELAPDLPAHPETPLLWIALVAEGEALAWIGMVDEVRSEAEALIRHLGSQNLRCELLTGDSSERARALGADLAFDRVAIGQSPEDKLQRVVELQAAGAVVTMIGDGLNDAPVLQRADASIAVAGATDLARAQADFVIERGDLEQIARLQRCARRTRAVILQNFSWAIAYNLIGIPAAAMGWIPPWAAALGMSASSLLVVANAARLRYERG